MASAIVHFCTQYFRHTFRSPINHKRLNGSTVNGARRNNSDVSCGAIINKLVSNGKSGKTNAPWPPKQTRLLRNGNGRRKIPIKSVLTPRGIREMCQEYCLFSYVTFWGVTRQGVIPGVRRRIYR